MSAQVPGQMPPGATGATGADGPSEEEVRQYLDQMRSAPVEQVLAEVLQGLLNAAQVKLGRKDARLLLDTAGTITDDAREHLSEQLAQQIDQALSQLRMAQVEAEKEASAQGAVETNDLGATPDAGGVDAAAPESSDTAAQQEPQPGSPGSQTSKLWIPGQ